MCDRCHCVGGTEHSNENKSKLHRNVNPKPCVVVFGNFADYSSQECVH